MPVKYMPAPEVQEIAKEMLPQFHQHLAMPDINFFFFVNYDGKGILKPVSECGDRLGYARVYTPEQKATLDAPDFGVGVLYNFFEKATDAQKKALVDHELLHCRYREEDEESDGPPQPYMEKHEFEGFILELERHGAWTKTYEEVAQQLRMNV
jgi:hypothetical protein